MRNCKRRRNRRMSMDNSAYVRTRHIYIPVQMKFYGWRMAPFIGAV